MKRAISRLLLCALLLLLAAAFGVFIFQYMTPMQAQVYDLSTLPEDGQEYSGDKGWTVFTQEGRAVTALTPDGGGGFSGLAHPGQTFYYSRRMTEALDSPMLRVGVANRSVAVYLDGALLYTDCPGQTGGIGTLALPMLDYDRGEPLLVSLPSGYAGKTLTVAQSTAPGGGEKPGYDDTVYPCEITLYCGYAYESALIAESWRIAVPAALLFAVGALLLVAFGAGLLRKRMTGAADWGLLCVAFAALLTALALSASPGYHIHYPGAGVDMIGLCRLFTLLALLVFLALRAKTHRLAFWLCAGLYGVSCVTASVLLLSLPAFTADAQVLFALTLPRLTGFFALLAMLVMGMVLQRGESLFYRLFSLLMQLGVAVYFLVLLLSLLIAPGWSKAVFAQIGMSVQNGFAYLLWRLMLLAVCCALVSEIAALVRREIGRRAEAAALGERVQLAQASYETLRQHNEEVMLLRHDLANHLKTLRSMSDPQAVAAYLDALLGQNENIRPIFRSGNEMLDILVNGKLPAAAEAGIQVELIKTEAPERIPLSDAELSSVVLNLLDNAIRAASAPGLAAPVIRLKAQCKDDFFVFSCENSSAPPAGRRAPEPGRGLGLKIIGQIAQRNQCVFTAEQLDGIFRAIFAVSLIGSDNSPKASAHSQSGTC